MMFEYTYLSIYLSIYRSIYLIYVNLCVSNAEATFVQSTRMQRFLKTI